jgi:hypothetical protein
MTGPTRTPEPPYYAVIFTSRRNEQPDDGYRWDYQEVPYGQGNHHPSICPYGLFHCADGLVQPRLAQGSRLEQRPTVPSAFHRHDDARLRQRQRDVGGWPGDGRLVDPADHDLRT